MVIIELVAAARSWHLTPGGAVRPQWNARESLVVGVRAASGEIGIGEAAPLPGMSRDTLADVDRSCASFTERIPLHVESPAQVAGVVATVDAPAARFALETALLAALAQRARTSLAYVLAAAPQHDVTRAIVVDSDGDPRLTTARCVKIKLGRPATAADLMRVVRIARAAPAARLRFDANRGWPRDVTPGLLRAIAAALGADAARVDYVEEPCALAHELLVEPLPLPIALDESLIELPVVVLDTALASGRLAALVLKPTLLGGLGRCIELAALARSYGVAAIASHALESSIGRAACTQLARALGGTHAHGVDA
jgi:O-succinylbenzoate synthase